MLIVAGVFAVSGRVDAQDGRSTTGNHSTIIISLKTR
jgi:hypothetical protein